MTEGALEKGLAEMSDEKVLEESREGKQTFNPEMILEFFYLQKRKMTKNYGLCFSKYYLRCFSKWIFF